MPDIFRLTDERLTRESEAFVISLFDYTGIWSQPYRDAGYEVMQVDLQLGQDILETAMPRGRRPRGIIMQPPCTDFATSGARWFEEKDEDGRTMNSMVLVYAALAWVATLEPHWWVLENPMSRIHTLIPELGRPTMEFSPHEFGETYQKTTWLWGQFNTGLVRAPELPQGQHVGRPNEWHSRWGGRDGIRGKNERSKTSQKFAAAWFAANP